MRLITHFILVCALSKIVGHFVDRTVGKWQFHLFQSVIRWLCWSDRRHKWYINLTTAFIKHALSNTTKPIGLSVCWLILHFPLLFAVSMWNWKTASAQEKNHNVIQCGYIFLNETTNIVRKHLHWACLVNCIVGKKCFFPYSKTCGIRPMRTRSICQSVRSKWLGF